MPNVSNQAITTVDLASVKGICCNTENIKADSCLKKLLGDNQYHFPKKTLYLQVRGNMTAEIDEIHHATETTINTLSIIFNCYLLYLIEYQSTFGVKLYKYLLTIDAVLDLCLSVATLLAQPAALISNGNCVCISNGFFAGRSAAVDSFILTFYLFVLHTNIVWIPVQFVYRYRLLCKDNAKSKFSIIVVAVIYCMVALWIIRKGFSEVRDEYQLIGQQVLDANNWPSVKHHFFIGRSINDWLMVVYVSLWVLTCCISIGIVVWCERSITKSFNQLSNLSKGSANSNTQRMHREFHRALLAMAICPLVTTSVPYKLIDTRCNQVLSAPGLAAFGRSKL
ncbi:serpentine type 7TM GPCR chemoreceptor str domain-containing protein [Ditylenchus destructor]|uniref:Serpentine type 7TM GPCR chemoreceptor str domain-containing protein n=1 Tax=Ditylenchus destructor TaxID=166010 RepID=A0AAD4MKI4_9BILA|nr:serpentine type 7TM GPCR chemoreceptor str domain-containing protein [Ditylenchus destructor]